MYFSFVGSFADTKNKKISFPILQVSEGRDDDGAYAFYAWGHFPNRFDLKPTDEKTANKMAAREKFGVKITRWGDSNQIDRIEVWGIRGERLNGYDDFVVYPIGRDSAIAVGQCGTAREWGVIAYPPEREAGAAVAYATPQEDFWS